MATALRRHPATVWLTYVLFSLFFGWLLWRRRDVLASLEPEDAVQFALLSALGLLMVAGRGLLNVFTFRPFGAEIGPAGGFELAVVQTMGNYLPFSAGLVAKAVILNRRHQVPYSTYSVVSLYTFAAAVSASGALGLAALWWLAPERLLLATGFAVMAAGVVVLFLPVRWLLDRLVPGRVDWRDLRRRFRGILGRVLLLYAGLLALSAVRLVLAFSVFDHPIGYSAGLLLSSGAILSRLVNLTPASLGVHEGILAGLGLVTGFDPAITVLAVAVDRLAETLVVFAAGAVHLRQSR